MINSYLIVDGQQPERKRKLTLDSDSLRFDNVGHWIVSTPAGKDGKPSWRNCKKCSNDGRKDAKAVNMCEKCNVGLHVNCFKERIYIRCPNKYSFFKSGIIMP